MITGVRMREGEFEVICPYCGRVLKWDPKLGAFDPATVCEHLDKDVSITPVASFKKEYDVWFREDESCRK